MSPVLKFPSIVSFESITIRPNTPSYVPHPPGSVPTESYQFDNQPFEMRDPQPFSGLPGENVNHYIKQCKYAWVGVNMSSEDRSEAQAMSLLQGLRGVALEFANTLPTEIQDNFQQ
ncbi:uncharacterized protein N7525_007603 [Penicillium rubens]|uniref:uncharacterized protein n=1 Tax=Penicillium rubens TaxID=1108849 RepID=UPI002A5AFC03|nr:uncharacterized protein N7525_007603 [Penicillium rubens]KAJ5829350.1 hypothetical protein N7525_007603 [Penicillium rubens]